MLAGPRAHGAPALALRVLVSSDLTSRGIDVDRVNLVVNLEPPPAPHTYL